MDTGVYPMWDRFGFNYESGQAWNAITKIIASEYLELVGLHCHIGTFMLTTAAYAVAPGKLSDLAVSVNKIYGKVIQYLDLGGGFPSANTLRGAHIPGADIIPSIDEFAEAITTTILNYGYKKENCRS
jgi:diaminopimelate decarboxylase